MRLLNSFFIITILVGLATIAYYGSKLGIFDYIAKIMEKII